MKTKQLLFALLLVFPFAVQAGNVPEAVTKAFAKKYPAVAETSVKWETEDKNFEAEFKTSEGKEISAVFKADGTLLTTEEEIETSALPAAIAEHITKNCATPVIRKAEVIKDASGKIKQYEVEACGKEELLFDASGQLAK